jgi:hypothetical protein
MEAWKAIPIVPKGRKQELSKFRLCHYGMSEPVSDSEKRARDGDEKIEKISSQESEDQASSQPPKEKAIITYEEGVPQKQDRADVVRPDIKEPHQVLEGYPRPSVEPEREGASE